MTTRAAPLRQAIRRSTVDDLLAVSILAIGGLLVSLVWFQNDTGIPMLFLYIPPTAYLWMRSNLPRKKIILSALVIGACFGMVLDIFATFNHAWYVVFANPVLDWRGLGGVPIGDFIWAFLIVLFPVSFYERFLDTERTRPIGSAAVIAGLASLAYALLFVMLFPDFPRLPYPYALIGLGMLAPLVFLAVSHRDLVRKIVLIGAYFFVFNACAETVWLLSRSGGYPGMYLAWINIGLVLVPIEELLFWIIASTPVIIVMYELLFDDFR